MGPHHETEEGPLRGLPARGIGALGCNASFLVIARSGAARCVSAVYPHILMGCPRYGGVGTVNARERERERE